MANTSAVSTSFKVELMRALHDFASATGNSFNGALYTGTATLDATVTSYATAGEISGTGYTAGGATMQMVTPTSSGTTAILDILDLSWTSASFTANALNVYNDTNSNRSVFSIAFGSDKTVSSGTFSIVWPTADASNAIIRLA